MSHQRILSSRFNMSLGFIPVIISIILCEFITQDMSIYIGAGVGLLFSIYSVKHRGTHVPQIILYCTTGMLLLLSVTTLFFVNYCPRFMLPFTLEISAIIPPFIIYLNRRRFLDYHMSQTQKCSKQLFAQGAEAAIVSARVILIISLLHFLIIFLAILISHPLGSTTRYILFHVAPPLVFISSILFNQFGIFYFNIVMNHTVFVPIVNTKGDVTGKAIASEAINRKNNYINPVVRIAVASHSMLFLITGYLFIILLRRQVKKANKEVRLQNQKLSLAIKGSNMAYWEFDVLTGAFNAYNDPVNDYDVSHTLTLDDYHQCMDAADKLTMQPHLELMLEGRDESYSLDVRMKTRYDKEWRNCTITGTPFEKDPLTGRVTKYVGFRQDNTELVKLNHEVSEYVQKMRYVLFHSNILFWEFDVDMRTIRLDNGDDSMQEVIPTERLLEERIVPDKRDEVRLLLNRLAGRLEEEFTSQWEMLPLKDSGNTGSRYVIINGMPMKDSSGKIVAYSGLRRDVTDLILTQQKLAHETERALQSDRLKSAFLANMSHEIRTPLNAIVGFSGLLQETDDPEERKEYIQLINTNNELLLNLINDILDLSRIESGEVTLSNEYFDLVHYFGNLAASLQQRCVNPEVRFIIERPYTKCNVFLDRSRLAQICTNFATNAIKHTRKGSIRIGYAYVDGGITLYVEDTGNGIPADKQHLVFQRFEKLDPFVQGTGLGLSICKAIVDACGGKIGFTSKEGQGSEFWAWLPCEAEVIS